MSMYEQDKAQSRGEGLEKIEEGIEIINNYNLYLLLDDANIKARDKVIQAISLIEDGFDLLKGEKHNETNMEEHFEQ